MLFILSNTEDGLHCQMITRKQFDAWVKERTEGVKPEYHPKFLSTMPTDASPTNEYLVINGEIVVPKPVTTVTTYALDT